MTANPKGSTSRQWAEGVIDQAISLEPGERLAFPMGDLQQLAAYRMQLHRERERAFSRIGPAALNLTIFSSGLYLIIKKSATVPLQGILIKQDGSQELAPPISISQPVSTTLSPMTMSDLDTNALEERRRMLMELDGVSEADEEEDIRLFKQQLKEIADEAP